MSVEQETHDALAGISAGQADVLEGALELREAQLENTRSSTPGRSGWSRSRP